MVLYPAVELGRASLSRYSVTGLYQGSAGAGNYVRLHVGAADHLLRSTSTAMEAQLDPGLFIRIHRRYIVNVDRIVEVQPWFAGDAIAVLRNGVKLRVSRTYRERLHTRLGARPDPAAESEAAS